MSKYKLADIEQSEHWLREALGPQEDRTVYLILRSVAPSGLSRVVTPILMPNPGAGIDVLPLYPAMHIARLLGLSWLPDQQAVRLRGGGMDMGWSMVYDLSQRLYGNSHRLRHRWL